MLVSKCNLKMKAQIINSNENANGARAFKSKTAGGETRASVYLRHVRTTTTSTDLFILLQASGGLLSSAGGEGGGRIKKWRGGGYDRKSSERSLSLSSLTSLFYFVPLLMSAVWTFHTKDNRLFHKTIHSQELENCAYEWNAACLDFGHNASELHIFLETRETVAFSGTPMETEVEGWMC